MSKGTKVALGIVGGLLILCSVLGIGGFLLLKTFGEQVGGNLITDDPKEVAAEARSIVDYRLPPGYEEQGLMNIIFYRMLMLGPKTGIETNNSRPMIIVVEFGDEFGGLDETTQDQMQQSMENAAQQGDVSLQLVSSQEWIMRDQSVIVSEFTGKDGQGNAVRQVITSPFEGKNGILMIMIMGTEDGWSAAEVDSFLRSIR